MNRAIRYVLTLAVTATGLAAGPARADHDRDCDRRAAPAAAYPAYPAVPAPPVYAPAPVPAPVYAPAYPRVAWRLQALREEYRRLDWARDRFYATWHGNPWRRDRFEAWYASRRAQLDERRAELERWRGHERWQG
jgi:hypothetical protein